MIFEAKSLTVGYGEPLIKNLSFCVKSGEIYEFSGKNGIGKSTLALALSGLDKSVVLSGQVLLDGADIFSLTAAERAAVGLAFQNTDNALICTRVRDELAFAPENLQLPRAEIVKRVNETAALCGITALLDKKTAELSHGEKQRVALAAALTAAPSLLVADEVTAHLDAAACAAIENALAEYVNKGGAAIVFTHRPMTNSTCRTALEDYR